MSSPVVDVTPAGSLQLEVPLETQDVFLVVHTHEWALTLRSVCSNTCRSERIMYNTQSSASRYLSSC